MIKVKQNLIQIDSSKQIDLKRKEKVVAISSFDDCLAVLYQDGVLEIVSADGAEVLATARSLQNATAVQWFKRDQLVEILVANQQGAFNLLEYSGSHI